MPAVKRQTIQHKPRQFNQDGLSFGCSVLSFSVLLWLRQIFNSVGVLCVSVKNVYCVTDRLDVGSAGGAAHLH